MKKIILLAIITTILIANASADLITITSAICTSPDNNQTWFDGNTYFLNVDSNVDVSNCQLTINPGAIVKFKINVANYLNITNKGVLKAQGTSTNKIVFTSGVDDSIGTAAQEHVEGVFPKKGDYGTAINFSNTAGLTSDANDLFNLNIGYSSKAIEFGFASSRTYNSIHDLNVHDTNVAVLANNGSIRIAGKLKNFYNNTITDNNAVTAATAGVSMTGAGAITNFYDNTIFNNSTAGAGAGVRIVGSVTNFYNNQITYNVITGNSAVEGAGVRIAGEITNFYDNNISNNATSVQNGTGIYFGGIVSNFFDNVISNNASVSGNGAGLFFDVSGDATNFFNNDISNNSTILGHGAGIYANDYLTGNVYNNVFQKNSAHAGSGIYCGVSIGNLYNNLFFDNNANTPHGIIENDGSITNLQNNVFAYNSGTAIVDSVGGIATSNNNAFWANDTNTSGYTEGANSVYLGTSPFINDGSDRNFLLNSYGIAQLQGTGDSTIGTDSYFQAKTVRFDNRLDYN
ncbi:MAG: hypothetical protein PHD95_04705, partial [Candidatus ainarchaeum sp.]|nr:hypothetical protein [Candidatus ainarchaeum sp.]